MMKIGPVVAAAAVFVIASPVCAQDAVQWRVEDGGNGHWYRFVRVASTIGWPSARQACHALGGELGIVDSQQLTTVLVPEYPPDTNACFIGCSFSNGAWRWVDGRAITWSNWCACGQPSGDGTAVEIWSDGVWNDIAMSGERQGYLMEWSADCNSDGIVDYGQIRDGTFPDVNANGVPDCCDQAESCTPCPGDVTNGGTVDAADLSILLAAWGTNGQGEFDTDLNGDGLVNGGDLAFVLSGWGACP
jgi:hypothetical protein